MLVFIDFVIALFEFTLEPKESALCGCLKKVCMGSGLKDKDDDIKSHQHRSNGKTGVMDRGSAVFRISLEAGNQKCQRGNKQDSGVGT